MHITREYFLTEDFDAPRMSGVRRDLRRRAEDLIAELEPHLGVPVRGDSVADRTDRLLDRLKTKREPVFKTIHLNTERKTHPPIIRNLLSGLESSGTRVTYNARPWNETPMAVSPPSRNDRQNGGSRLFVAKLFEPGPRLRLLNPFREDDPALGKALHAFFAASDLSSPPSAWLALAHCLLDACGREHLATPESMVESAQRLHGLIQRQGPESEIWRELPLRMRSDGPIVRGIADMVVVSPNGFHRIDYKAFPGRKDLCLKRDIAAGPQLLAYAEILERATCKPCRIL